MPHFRGRWRVFLSDEVPSPLLLCQKGPVLKLSFALPVVALLATTPAIAGPEAIRPLIARHAAANNVPVPLADAVVRIESRYNPAARNRANLGLTQISHQTARGIGYTGGAAGLLQAETNLHYGMKYLGMAYRMAGGDVCGTIMRYQSGLRATRMSGANKVYCGKVKALMGGRNAGRAG